MAIDQGKHEVEEIQGVRCTIVERGITSGRAEFLTKLLTHNGYKVLKAKDEETGRLIFGVTDLLFNPVIDVYERRLRSFSGKRVTPAFWRQWSDHESMDEVYYWDFTPLRESKA